MTEDPSVLISYFYFKGTKDLTSDFEIRDWVLDSGAFSAMNSGAEIDLDDYIDFCKEIMDGPNPPTEIFSLDVIGDAEGTKQNTEKMWRSGIEAIPAYHIGEPTEYLEGYAADYPKIALGGVAKLRPHSKKMAWASECFARVWPKKVHGFGFGAEDSVLGLPFHSTDSTTWDIGPCAFGRWSSYKGDISVKGVKDLRPEVEHYLALERRALVRWRKEMKLLGDTDAPRVRLAVSVLSPEDEKTGRYQAFKRKEPIQ